MIDPLMPEVARAQSEGAVVVLKWDGQRERGGCTVVISRSDTEYYYRQDADDMAEALTMALANYRSSH